MERMMVRQLTLAGCLGIVFLAANWWYKVPAVSYAVPEVVEDSSMYQDFARLALQNGEYALAKKYLDKSDDPELRRAYQAHMTLKKKVDALFEKAMLMDDQHTEETSFFSKLVSIELLDLDDKNDQSLLLWLVLAKLSSEKGFVLWDKIGDELEKLSQTVEKKEPGLSEVLYALSQERLEYD